MGKLRDKDTRVRHKPPSVGRRQSPAKPMDDLYFLSEEPKPTVLICSACDHKLHLDGDLSERWILCPECGEIMQKPAIFASGEEALERGNDAERQRRRRAEPEAKTALGRFLVAAGQVLTLSSSLSLAILGLVLFVVFVSGVSVVGTAAIVISVLGLLCGIIELLLSMVNDDGKMRYRLVGLLACGWVLSSVVMKMLP